MFAAELDSEIILKLGHLNVSYPYLNLVLGFRDI